MGIFTEILKHLNKWVLFSLLGVALVALGAISTLIDFSFLGYFFLLIRRLLSFVDFFWDTTTMLFLIGMSISISVLLWSFKGSLVVIRWFRSLN